MAEKKKKKKRIKALQWPNQSSDVNLIAILNRAVREEIPAKFNELKQRCKEIPPQCYERLFIYTKINYFQVFAGKVLLQATDSCF